MEIWISISLIKVTFNFNLDEYIDEVHYFQKISELIKIIYKNF